MGGILYYGKYTREQIDKANQVDLEELLSLTNRQFNERYRQTAAGWRGKKILQRNARIVQENLGISNRETTTGE